MTFDNLKQRLNEMTSIVNYQLLPCTQQEVYSIEQQLGLSLPYTYKEFLLLMGRGCGEFMQGSDFFFGSLLDIQEGAAEILQENNFPVRLPDDAFVFFMHQGYQFGFFRTSEGEDLPIYAYNEGSDQTDFIVSNQKFTEFLIKAIELHEDYLKKKEYIRVWF